MAERDYFKLSQIGLEKRWQREHSLVRINNKESKEKMAINAYLCGDGNISVRKDKNNETHYEIRFFLDKMDLAQRIVELFKKEFHVTPKIRIMKSTIKDGKGYFKIEIKNKPACLHLLSLGKYGGLNWTIPKVSSTNLLKEWIRCFFDCEAHVNTYNKQIQVKSVNQYGLKDIQIHLTNLGIVSKVYGPYKQKKSIHNDYFLLTIYGNSNLRRYKRLINFNHPNKKIDLAKII